MSSKVKLYPYQAKGFRTICHFKGVSLLADDMGLGKTIQALWYLKEHPDIRPVIIVTPAHLKWHWEGEAKDKTNLRAAVLEGNKPYSLRFATAKSIIIVNYDILSKWVETLLKLNPKCVIWDEAHFIKNRNAKRTQALRLLIKNVPHRIAISGTPLLQRPAELFPTINALWPEEFPSFFSFAQRYCKPVYKRWGWEYKGAGHLDELHRRLTRCGMIRRRKEDVLPDLPPKQRTVVPVTIPMEEYTEAEKNFIKWLSKKSVEKARKAKSAEQITQMGYLKRLAAAEKLPFVVQWIEAFLEQTDRKLVVYGIHKAVVRGLYKEFKHLAVILDGSSNKRERRNAVQDFQTKKRIRLFIGNIQAAGTGITLTAASNLLFAELDWVPGNHIQAEDRIHRIGQKGNAEITYLVARNTIEEKLCRIIQKKQETVTATLDGSAVENTLTVFDELLKGMKK